MPTSLIKFSGRQIHGERGQVFWGRADRDGLPFRGDSPPFYTDEEFEERSVKVADPRNGTFKTWEPEENKQLLEVYDKIANGWAQCWFVERWRDAENDRHVVYIEWGEYYLEDGTRATIGQANGVASYGQPNLAQYFDPAAG